MAESPEAKPKRKRLIAAELDPLPAFRHIVRTASASPVPLGRAAAAATAAVDIAAAAAAAVSSRPPIHRTRPTNSTAFSLLRSFSSTSIGIIVVVVAEAGYDVAHALQQRVPPVENISSKRQSVTFGGAEGPPEAREKGATPAVLVQAVERYLKNLE